MRDAIEKESAGLLVAGRTFESILRQKLAQEEELIFICEVHYEDLWQADQDLGDKFLWGLCSNGRWASSHDHDWCDSPRFEVMEKKSAAGWQFLVWSLRVSSAPHLNTEGWRFRCPHESGHHENIRQWRLYQSLKKTIGASPDLLENYELSAEEKYLETN